MSWVVEGYVVGTVDCRDMVSVVCVIGKECTDSICVVTGGVEDGAHLTRSLTHAFSAEGGSPDLGSQQTRHVRQGSRVLGLPSLPPASPLHGGLLGSFQKSQSSLLSC